MVYRRHEQPGCGGCFLLLLLLVFLSGGAPLLFDFLGLLAFIFLFLMLSGIAAFWLFTYYVKRQISAYEKSQTETHNTFVYLLVNILVKLSISKSDLIGQWKRRYGKEVGITTLI